MAQAGCVTYTNCFRRIVLSSILPIWRVIKQRLLQIRIRLEKIRFMLRRGDLVRPILISEVVEWAAVVVVLIWETAVLVAETSSTKTVDEGSPLVEEVGCLLRVGVELARTRRYCTNIKLYFSACHLMSSYHFTSFPCSRLSSFFQHICVLFYCSWEIISWIWTSFFEFIGVHDTTHIGGLKLYYALRRSSASVH